MNPTLVAILAAVALASTDLLVRYLGGSIGVGFLLLTGNLALGAGSVGVLLARRQSFIPRRWGVALLAGVFRALATACSIMALRMMEVATFYMVLYLFPMWVMLGGAIFLREVPRKWQVFGLALALLGCGLVFGRGAIDWSAAVCVALACSLFLAGQILTIRSLGNEDAFRISWIHAIEGMLLAGMFVWAEGPQNFWPSGHISIWMLLGLWLTYVLGPLGSTYASGRLKSFVFGLLCYLQIPMAVLGAWVCFGEMPAGEVSGGLVLLVVGALASQLPEKRKAVR